MAQSDPPAVSSSLMTEPPAILEAKAAALAHAHFGVLGRARLLGGERDENFLIAAESGDFVLKVANAAEDRDVIDFQAGALVHLELTDPTIPVPRVVRTADGDVSAAITDDVGAARILRLVSYIPGSLAMDAAPSAALRTQIGLMLGRLDRGLAGYRHSASRHELSWDLSRAGGLRPLLGDVADEATRARVERALDQFERSAPALPGLRAQVIHNDFSLFNILVGHADPAKVVGVIDFGDMIEAPLINEVAIAMSYHAGAHPDPLVPLEEILRAYGSIVPLSPEETDLLPDLVAMRLAQTVLITEWRARRYPENRAYILKNHPAATLGLARLAEAPRALAQQRFRRAVAPVA
ncbi:MAG TPA: phosphotransferase [Caulobacteraceae bacterium]|jgi:Ser/Thr protein kinase RdoA (MazF antagonist)|nr:phosphotransferase [Caulobacteraceae bacterium]